MLDTDRPTDFLAAVLAHIEAHCFEPLSVGALADVAGLSPYHFSRLFTARFGVSVMGYVRARRLHAAALRLSGDSPPALIDLALDCGFESQEAFTRAFVRRFGVPPGRFRRINQGERTMTQTMATAQVAQLDDPVTLPATTIAGVRALFDQGNKNGVPSLWPRLIQTLPLPGQTDAKSYGVCWLANADKGQFNYLAGVETRGEHPLPEGFERITLAPQSYLVFRITLDGSPVHPQMQSALPVIWGELLPKSGRKPVPRPDLEVYPADFEPLRAGAYIDIYIPVAD